MNVAQEILSYLNDHPNAKDTAKGIADWWLQGRSQEIAQKALDDLVRLGRMREFVSGDGTRYYSGVIPKLKTELPPDDGGKHRC